MPRKYLNILFFMGFIFLNNVLMSQEERAKAIKILKDNEQFFGVMGKKFFPSVKKLLTSEVTPLDLADYREDFFELWRSLPPIKRIFILVDENFEKKIYENIALIKANFTKENQNIINDWIKTQVNTMDDMLVLLTDLREHLESENNSENNKENLNFYCSHRLFKND